MNIGVTLYKLMSIIIRVVLTDTIYVFDQFNQNLTSRAVEQLFLDDGWDTDEIWNLIVGDDSNGSTDDYIGTSRSRYTYGRLWYFRLNRWKWPRYNDW